MGGEIFLKNQQVNYYFSDRENTDEEPHGRATTTTTERTQMKSHKGGPRQQPQR